MVLSSRRSRLGALLAAVAVLATAAPALAAGYDAKNADKVDGKHAVSSTTTASKRRNRLVAANRTGFLPNNIIKMAPNSSRLGGKTLAQVIASATDVYTAGAGLGLEAGQFSLLDPFRLPQGCAADEVAQFVGPGWGCLSLPQGTAYTAGDGLDLIGLTEFALEPGGVTADHLGTSSVDTDELAPLSVTEGKLSFDPATQTELNTHKTSTDHDGRYFTKLELQSPAVINLSGNPVDWTRLKNVPFGFADGNDADTNTTYTAGAGLGLSGTTFSVIFDGSGTLNRAARSDHNHDATLWKRAGNAGTNPITEFIGTTDDQALEFRVNNARVMRYQPNIVSPSIVGGSAANLVQVGVRGGTIGGGGDAAAGNEVTDDHGTVAGGRGNSAGGGTGATDDARYATVAGGSNNRAVGSESTVAGGSNNTATGTRSTVAGGFSNSASGSGSFAAGTRADANHAGSFVWGDFTSADVQSPGFNSFSVRASGGIWLGTTSSPTIPAGTFLNTSTGASLSTGGTWTNASDANLKTGFHSVDGVATLEALSQMPISTWSYKAEDRDVIHIGPTAQDFAAAFDVGANDRSIATVDADGVALSAIQGLYELVQDQQAQIDRLERLVLRRGGMNRVR